MPSAWSCSGLTYSNKVHPNILVCVALGQATPDHQKGAGLSPQFLGWPASTVLVVAELLAGLAGLAFLHGYCPGGRSRAQLSLASSGTHNRAGLYLFGPTICKGAWALPKSIDGSLRHLCQKLFGPKYKLRFQPLGICRVYILHFLYDPILEKLHFCMVLINFVIINNLYS